jgi:hypothetical protein
MNTLLWDYADGLLSENEAEKVRLLLLNDTLMQQQLDAILLEKKAFAGIELELPKRNFADSVMTKWTAEQFEMRKGTTPQSAGVDWILRLMCGILSAMFVVPLVLALGSGRNQKVKSPFSFNFDLTQKLTLPKMDYVSLLNNPFVFYAFCLGLAYLFLQIFDKMLQRKLTSI